jgi:hypothetical protein
MNYLPGNWLQTMILLISASYVAKITGMSLWLTVEIQNKTK